MAMVTVKELEERLLSRDLETVLKAVKTVSGLALESESSNSLVSNSKGLLVALLQLVDAGNVCLSTAAINAVMDLGITSLARQALVECGLGNHLVGLFLWLADALASSRRNKDMEELSELGFQTVEKLFLDHAEGVPKAFFFDVYRNVKCIWLKSRKDLKSGTRKPLARLLARLGLEQVDVLSQREPTTSTFTDFSEHFLEKHWERSPWMGTAVPQFLEEFFPARQNPFELLRALVETTVTCPLIPNDELNPLYVFEELQESLGDDLKYEEDIRLVKCSASSEEHYAKHVAEQVVSTEDVLQAFQSGYTVAVRGMEFRSPAVAVVAERLGLQVGQASVGANLYITPPNSQGLALHYDDHCVFVIQVAGQKNWSIYPPEDVLPRLYERRGVPYPTGTPLDVLLSEGELLYIPRGFPHRAVAASGKRKRCCVSREDHASSKVRDFSLHLTFAVEVEAPFTWEGFVHIAVYNWALSNWKCETDEERAAKAVLHFAVKSVGDKEASFRKACLVAMPSADETSNVRTFTKLIKALELNAGFDDACEVMRSESECLDWLRHIDTGWFQELDLALGLLETQEMREIFTVIKSQFVKQEPSLVQHQVYDKAQSGFIFLLERYRAGRRTTTNVMLALH